MWISKLSNNTYYSICICIVFKNPTWELIIFFWEFVTQGSRRHPLQPRSQVKPHFFSADAFQWGDSVYYGLKGIISKNANTNYQLVIYSRTVHIISAVGWGTSSPCDGNLSKTLAKLNFCSSRWKTSWLLSWLSLSPYAVPSLITIFSTESFASKTFNVKTTPAELAVMPVSCCTRSSLAVFYTLWLVSYRLPFT